MSLFNLIVLNKRNFRSNSPSEKNFLVFSVSKIWKTIQLISKSILIKTK